MLVIKVEIWPHGDGKKRKEIARMKIINNGKCENRPYLGNYDCEIKDDHHNTFEENIVENHDRMDSVWFLVCKVLQNFFFG